ncbi:unnamed protein product [Closterium sp. NIES-53]
MFCLSVATSSSTPTADSSHLEHGPLVSTGHRYHADLEERGVREEQEEQEVQEEQEEQGAQGVQVALEALLAHGETTRRR